MMILMLFAFLDGVNFDVEYRFDLQIGSMFKRSNFQKSEISMQRHFALFSKEEKQLATVDFKQHFPNW